MTSKSELLPERLVGKEWKKITDPATQKTFRVVRAVSELECLGHFQSINGYDDAWMSLGPCHWTLAIGNSITRLPGDREVGEGELPAFMAYWTGKNPDEAKTRFTEPFGVTASPTWKSGSPGTVEGGWGARNYTGRLRWQKGTVNGPSAPADIKLVEDLDWFRTTHWFWRYLALARNVESFRLAQWDMVRIRIRDILAYQIDPADRPGATVAGKNLLPLSKLFTSEASVALLLRCHIRRSNFLSHSGYRFPSLRLALAFAGITEKDPAKWDHPEEMALIEGMLAAAALAGVPNRTKLVKELKALDVASFPSKRKELAELPSAGELFRDCQSLLGWPEKKKFKWGAGKAAPSNTFSLEQAAATPSLRREHGSFAFDADNLPPLPR